ncbi:chloride channel protein [Aggregicoccus sp. 17bor-14]|uniref:chloride channel protein n=1 Tax=Myxococcaceae TaxID=31 RepID=UPI00129C2211|nr:MULTISPECIES: chloride channel protein [Myxococcaceae]MBF5041962.1 chloride channel protein [Simulacricoccus sp. 17bor-14]MRI87743.1 chloride channel protein [Aggregicoccus sp. 17bor-14]
MSAPPKPPPLQRVHLALRTLPPRLERAVEALPPRLQRLVDALLAATNRVHLPSASVLPFAGAVVGVYSGLAAGIFANLIGLVSGMAFGFPHVIDLFRKRSDTRLFLAEALAGAHWHFEYIVVALPLALGGLALARLISPGGPRDVVRRRLRVLALLTLGALALYYPLVALAAVNTVLGRTHNLGAFLKYVPWFLVLLAPTLGGMVVGRILRNHPEAHGHGVPEVVRAVEREGAGLPAHEGLRKLVASAVTIGSGGSAGREGPIVFGGAAFGSEVGRTLGFSRRDLSILLACGAGAGIAASFNAPIAGALFAMEILLREIRLQVFSPIILASVTATMVGRGVMGSAPMLARVNYSMVSGWEILAYGLLGVVCGLLAFLFLEALHAVEALFQGKGKSRLSQLLGKRGLPFRAGLGGLLAGALALVHPAVWGTGHEYANEAAVGKLTLGVLALGCVAKLLATALTIGSGGSGGTFFPATVIGALGGGALGEALHRLLPGVTAPSGAYAMVGMGGTVAAMTRGPLTGMMMIYELSGNYAIILPLMVTCTIASFLCHALAERRAAQHAPAERPRRQVPVGTGNLIAWTGALAPDVPALQVRERLLASPSGALPVRGVDGAVAGVIAASALGARWRLVGGESTAAALAEPATPLGPATRVADALEAMDAQDVDALPVVDGEGGRVGVVTRGVLRRFLEQAPAAQPHGAPPAAPPPAPEEPFAPTEMRS